MTEVNKSISHLPAKRRRLLLILGTFFSLIAIAAVLYWMLVSRYIEETENAYVQGNIVQITPQIAGTVSKVFVDDTNAVKAGQALLSFDMADVELALTQADAQLAQTVREVRTLYTNQAQLEANLNLRNAELERALDDLARRKALTGTGAVSGEEIRHAELAVTTAKAVIAVAQQQLASGRALTDGTSVKLHPNVARAAARIQELMLTQARSTLYAPVAGDVAKRNVQVGQRINQGAPVMAIVPADQLWVDANFKEAQLRKIRINQPVTLTADLYGSKIKYDGKIIGIGAGTGSAFALLPAQNATGNWIKVVQRVPVRISLDPKQVAEHPLRVGLSMTAEVDLHDQSGAQISLNQDLSNGNNVASDAVPVDAKAKARIDKIIAANLK
jgi:membrane fusion protein (multidrug efflux system)